MKILYTFGLIKHDRQKQHERATGYRLTSAWIESGDSELRRNMMARLRFGATLLFALVNVPSPLHAQQASVALSVCNAGKVDIDVFVAKERPVASSHIVPAACTRVYSENAGLPAYVGFGLVDSHGQWGTARRLDLLPEFGIGVLTKADRNVSVRRGDKDVSARLQLLFRPPNPSCRQTNTYSASAHLSINATASERGHAAMLDRIRPPSETICDTLKYALNVVADPNSREITFNKFCEPCDKNSEARITPEERAARQRRSDAVNQDIAKLKATGPLGALVMGNVEKLGKQQAQEEEREREQERRKERPESYTRMNWNEMNLALAHVHGSGGRPPEMPEFLIVRGTVSRVDLSPPGASEHWVNVYFRESSEQASSTYETSYGAFNVCASDATIFEDMFGPDFRSRMIGQVLEVQGEYQRNYCKGWKGSIRVTTARQVQSAGSKNGKDQTRADTGISYGDFLKAVAKAQEQEPKAPPVVSMQTMAAREQEENRKRWAPSHQSPASYDPQWMGQDMVVTGTVSRVEVRSDPAPHWVTIYFKESPDAIFVVCSPYPQMFRARVGPDLSVLVGKTLAAAGQVEHPYCGNKVTKGSIRVVGSEDWQLH
jgi:hypothetical protein